MKFRSIINAAKRHFKWVERNCGISGVQLWALWEVQQAKSLRVNYLAAAMAIHQSTVSALLNALVKAKLIERNRSEGDQRVVNLSVTVAGRKLLSEAPEPARGVLPDALHRLPPNALRSLDELLGRVLSEMKVGRQPMTETLGDLLMKR